MLQHCERAGLSSVQTEIASSNPTNPLTTRRPQNPSIDVSELHKGWSIHGLSGSKTVNESIVNLGPQERTLRRVDFHMYKQLASRNGEILREKKIP